MSILLPPDKTLSQVLARFGEIIKNPKDALNMIDAEAVTALRSCDVDMVRAFADLGFTPADHQYVFDGIFQTDKTTLEKKVELVQFVLEQWPDAIVHSRLAGALLCGEGQEIVLVEAGLKAGLVVNDDCAKMMYSIVLHDDAKLRGARRAKALLTSGLIKPTSNLVIGAINIYFNCYHRKWGAKPESKRIYAEFINELIENDQIPLGPEAIPSLKRLLSLSLFSRKSKSKIQAAALAAELVGNSPQDE